MRARLALSLLVLAAVAAAPARAAVVVGSKTFTESVILGEIVAQWLRVNGFEAHHQRELGGTRLLWNATRRGDIAVYPDYTGTLLREILAGRRLASGDRAELAQALAGVGLALAATPGFSNNYALAMPSAREDLPPVTRVSELAGLPGLRFGFSNEFMRRADGWPGLRRRYALPQSATGLDHDVAYRGLAAGTLDVIDVYTTDAEIEHYGLRLLEDDLGYFPRYDAVLVARADLPPAAAATLARLDGRIDAATMLRMNRAVKLEGRPERDVAAEFLRATFGVTGTVEPAASLASRIGTRTREHLALTGISLALALAAALPLGILAARAPRLGHWLLGACGVLQTVPALALLVVLVPPLGIGAAPAVAALFLYSLLPVLRNTCVGLTSIPAGLLDSADALGLPRRWRLWYVELPLALPTILAGIKTAAVINVGTATLGALVGAGGYGQPILTGIRLDDTGLILQGAVPAALLALAVQGLFDLIERRLIPRGLRT